MKLAIQKYLSEHGLEKTVADLALEMRQNEKLVLLKYNSIKSDYKHQEVQESRGIILEKGTWNVVSLSFYKFFNYGESYAHEMDWESTRVFKKYDGSLITLYYYNGEWHTATTGTIDGMTSVGYYDTMTFSGLFWQTVQKVTGKTKAEFTEKLATGYSYMFELCTPYNIVVCPHGESALTLLAVRNLDNLEEIHLEHAHLFNLNIPIAETFPLSADLNLLKDSLMDKPFHEEGYVLCDKNFNRLKIKNPSYVAAHHLKGKSALHHILTIIKTNEVEEYAATFVERSKEIRLLQAEYYNLIDMLNNIWKETFNEGKGFESRKDFAVFLFEKVKELGLRDFTDFFFKMKNMVEYIESGAPETNKGFIPNYNAEQYINVYKDRELYEILIARVNKYEKLELFATQLDTDLK